VQLQEAFMRGRYLIENVMEKHAKGLPALAVKHFEKDMEPVYTLLHWLESDVLHSQP